MEIFGRLFRSEGQKSEKRNLMIFVTARLVDPAGNVIKKTSAAAAAALETATKSAP